MLIHRAETVGGEVLLIPHCVHDIPCSMSLFKWIHKPVVVINMHGWQSIRSTNLPLGLWSYRMAHAYASNQQLVAPHNLHENGNMLSIFITSSTERYNGLDQLPELGAVRLGPSEFSGVGKWEKRVFSKVSG